MSEVVSRPKDSATRGRGGGRGGRGGFGRSGPNRRAANGEKSSTSDMTSFDDDGDVGQLRKQYGGSLDIIKGIFSDWSDADILYALQETEGDVEITVTRISEGTISQWGEVSKPKKAPKPKAKDLATSTTSMHETTGNTRSSRGRSDGSRGGRGARGSDRARGGRGRASAHGATNGNRFKENHQLSVPTEESSGWGNIADAADDGTTNTNEWGTTGWGTSDTTATTTKQTTATEKPAAPATATPATETLAPKPKTWANVLKGSTQPKVAPKPKEPVPKPAEVAEPLPPVEPTPAAEPEPEPKPIVEETVQEEPDEQRTPVPVPVEPVDAPKIVEPEVALQPPEDDLTKANLEQLPDTSHPPATATAASTAADSWDPRQAATPSAAVTPLSAAQASRPVASGFAASAIKATTERPPRAASFQRRLLEQEEAVRMPGNREVDRTAVQFGAFSLNGEIENDIDGDREEAETRTQPPADSPIQPRASLPPTTQPAQVPEAFPAPATQKPVTTLPQPPQPTGPAGTIPVYLPPYRHGTNMMLAAPVAPPTGPSAVPTAPAAQGPASSQQYSRFSQTNAQEQPFPPKPYDNFGQPPATSTAGFDSFPAPAAAPAPTTQAPTQPSAGAFSSAPSEYSSYYTADQQSRNYNSYYGQYGQHGQAHNEGPNTHQRPFGGYNATQNNDNLSQYPQSSRYGASATVDAHNSGHNTPNPAGQSQQQQAGQSSGPQSNLHQQPPNGGYPYGHPYYNSPFYAQYVNQTYNGYGQAGYGGGPYGKAGIYGQPHQYGISHQGPYDHASSPATSGFGQSSLGGRDNGLGSSIDNYGRASSTQSGAQGLGNAAFGGAHDAFGRASAYQSPGQPFNAPNAQAASSNDDLKPYGEAKAGAGPSPSLSAAARPGSATNNTPGQSGLPPPQSAAQGMGGYGGYPSHLQGHGLHGNQSASSGYGLGGAGGQGHGSNPYGGGYGGYGGGQGFANYGGRQGQGWGNNY